ncbi:MAG: hypothetical protein FGM57_00100 [Candidatus Taylorbacteria bacterium]|nr:hypothetical protein [Candidatus Taylorbacteria bacterium]
MYFVLLLITLLGPSSVDAATTTKSVWIQSVPCTDITEIIQYQSSDSKTKGQVTRLQNFLIQRGFLSGTSTGFFDIASVAALRKYQLKSKMADLGITDARTRQRIKNDTCTKEQINEISKKIKATTARPRGLTPTLSRTDTRRVDITKPLALEDVVITKTTAVLKNNLGGVIGSTTTVFSTGKKSENAVLASQTSTTTSRRIVTTRVRGKVNVTSPYTGMALKAGMPASVTWGTVGYSADDAMRLVLVNENESEIKRIPNEYIHTSSNVDLSSLKPGAKVITVHASSLSNIYRNKGMYSWSVPNTLPYGSGYRIFVGPVDDPQAGAFSEPFIILGTGMTPKIKSVRNVKSGAKEYLVNISGENLSNTQSVIFSLNGRELSRVDSSKIKVFGSSEMQFTVSASDMVDMPKGVYYSLNISDGFVDSEEKKIIFW